LTTRRISRTPHTSSSPHLEGRKVPEAVGRLIYDATKLDFIEDRSPASDTRKGGTIRRTERSAGSRRCFMHRRPDRRSAPRETRGPYLVNPASRRRRTPHDGSRSRLLGEQLRVIAFIGRRADAAAASFGDIALAPLGLLTGISWPRKADLRQRAALDPVVKDGFRPRLSEPWRWLDSSTN
jgi:hypothetical protein